MNKVLVSLVFLLLFSYPQALDAQRTVNITFEWSAEIRQLSEGRQTYQYRTFRNAVPDERHPTLPVAVIETPLARSGDVQVEIVRADFVDYPGFEPLPGDQAALGPNLRFEAQVEKHRQNFFGKVAFVPIVRRGNTYQRISDIELRISVIPRSRIGLRSPDDVKISILNDGLLYKIATSEEGIHKLTYSFLRDELGIAIDNVDPRNIAIYGDEGGILPFFLGAERYEDIPEIAIEISGEGDGSFDPGDFILFHAQGPDKWIYNADQKTFQMQKNIFDTKNHYYIKIGNQPGKRITGRDNLSSAAYSTATFDDFDRFESDKVNLLFEWGKALSKSQGSGRQWFGDHFKNLREYSYEGLFTFPNRVQSSPVLFSARMALRALSRSTFEAEINGLRVQSSQANRIPVLSGEGDNEKNYAESAIIFDSVVVNGESFDFTVRYPFPTPNDASEGWLDYLQVNVQRNLVFTGEQMAFRDKNSLSFPTTAYTVSGAGSNISIWDITDVLNPAAQEFATTGQSVNFGTTSGVLRTFIAFRCLSQSVDAPKQSVRSRIKTCTVSRMRTW